MRVALRVDASSEMGTGHVRRCLSLAQALAEQGADTVLVVRLLDDVAPQVLQRTKHPVLWLPPAQEARAEASPADNLPPHHAWARVGWQQDAHDTCAALRDAPPDWVVVDHYAFDARWHDAVRTGLGCRLLVIDDIADRALAPDVLLDHNWAPDHRDKYRGRLTRQPVWLTGPRFALLSPAYRSAPRYRFHPQVRSLGIFMGGTDPGGISAKVLHCVRAKVQFAGPVEVVSTSSNPHLVALRAACAAWPDTQLTLNEPDLAGFFARHDLHIGAGGGATWERCCIGAPSLALCLADNQRSVLRPLESLGVVRSVDEAAPTESTIALALQALLENSALRKRLSLEAQQLVDGLGIYRIANHMLGK